MLQDDPSANSSHAPYVVSYLDEAQRARAEEVARQLEQPLITGDTHQPFVLMVTEAGLELHHHTQTNARPTILRCDIGSPEILRRLAGGKSQDLAKAVGIRKGQPLPHVLDATAGLGRDSFVLAHLGCHVQMVERHPLIAALLADGLARGTQNPQTASVTSRLSLVQADARNVLSSLNHSDTTYPTVIYLDPMYPPTNKGALPKKEMQVLRQLLGADEVMGLLEQSLALEGVRVVVKRPKHAPATPKPNTSFKGKQTRFDVYV
ncbi:MAG: class I SAM-dependent methyltransferase [Deinococcota bacterium]